MSVNFFLCQKFYVRQEYIAEDNLRKVDEGNGDDPPEDMSEALMDGCPPEWGPSPLDFGPM